MYRDYRILPSGKPKHLAVLLHGVGANGQDLLGLAEIWKTALPDHVFVSPDAPQAYDMAPFGHQWFSLRERNLAVMEKGAGEARTLLDAYLDGLLKEFSLPAAKLTLVGFSQGTMMSLYAGLRRKEKIAGILGYSGMLLGDDYAPPFPPIQLVHGREDEVVPFAASEHSAAVLKAKGADVTLLACSGLGHGIDDEGLRCGAAFLQRIAG
jgi:phospholipase/carboxylesterase